MSEIRKPHWSCMQYCLHRDNWEFPAITRSCPQLLINLDESGIVALPMGFKQKLQVACGSESDPAAYDVRSVVGVEEYTALDLSLLELRFRHRRNMLPSQQNQLPECET